MTTLRTFFSKRTQALTRLDPERDWIVLLLSSILILTGIVIWNAWAFDTIAGDGVIGSVSSTTPPVFKQSSLETVHSIFVKRALEKENYAANVYQYTDPSL